MAPLTADAKRLRTIIISFPLLVVTSAILYRRTYLGEEQRRIPARTQAEDGDKVGRETLMHGGSAIGGAPWKTYEQQEAEKAVAEQHHVK